MPIHSYTGEHPEQQSLWPHCLSVRYYYQHFQQLKKIQVHYSCISSGLSEIKLEQPNCCYMITGPWHSPVMKDSDTVKDTNSILAKFQFDSLSLYTKILKVLLLINQTNTESLPNAPHYTGCHEEYEMSVIARAYESKSPDCYYSRKELDLREGWVNTTGFCSPPPETLINHNAWIVIIFKVIVLVILR